VIIGAATFFTIGFVAQRHQVIPDCSGEARSLRKIQ
jgi:hypothetical protein